MDSPSEIVTRLRTRAVTSGFVCGRPARFFSDGDADLLREAAAAIEQLEWGADAASLKLHLYENGDSPNQCLVDDVEHFRLQAVAAMRNRDGQSRAANKAIKRAESAESALARAQKEVSILTEMLHPMPSPCGHSSQYAHTEDGGKTINCYVCELVQAQGEIERLTRIVQTYERAHERQFRAALAPPSPSPDRLSASPQPEEQKETKK